MEMEPGNEYNPYKTQKPIPAKRKSLENLAEDVFQQNASINSNYHGSVHDSSQYMGSQGSPGTYQGATSHHGSQRQLLQNNGSQRNLYRGNQENSPSFYQSNSSKPSAIPQGSFHTVNSMILMMPIINYES